MSKFTAVFKEQVAIEGIKEKYYSYKLPHQSIDELLLSMR